MNRTFFLSAVITAFIIGGISEANAQTKKYPEPDIVYKLYYFDEKGNEAVELEKADLESTTRTKGYAGIGTQEQIYQTPGEKSVVRIGKKEKLNFLIKLYDPNQDITKEFWLVKLKYNPKTKNRELMTMKASSWSDKIEENFETIRFTQSKVYTHKDGDGNVEYLIRMVTVENLEAGEYVWMHGWGNGEGFFAVD